MGGWETIANYDPIQAVNKREMESLQTDTKTFHIVTDSAEFVDLLSCWARLEEQFQSIPEVSRTSLTSAPI